MSLLDYILFLIGNSNKNTTLLVLMNTELFLICRRGKHLEIKIYEMFNKNEAKVGKVDKYKYNV